MSGRRLSVPSFGPDAAADFDVPPQQLTASWVATAAAPISPVDAALAYLVSAHNISTSQLHLRDMYTTDSIGVTHLYFRQVVHGLDVANADVNVNVRMDGSIVAAGVSVWSGNVDAVDRPERTELKENMQTLGTAAADDASSLWWWYKAVTRWFSTSSSDDDAETMAARQRLFLRRNNHPSSSIISPEDAVRSFASFIQYPTPLDTITVSNTFLSDASWTNQHSEMMAQHLSAKPILYRLSYLRTGPMGRDLRLVWDLEIDMQDNYFHSLVDARSGDVLQTVDWVSDFVVPQSDEDGRQVRFVEERGRREQTMEKEKTPYPPSPLPPVPLHSVYRVYPIGINDPNDGDRVVVKDPADPLASPFGWHRIADDDVPEHRWNDTHGNNVLAIENRFHRGDGDDDQPDHHHKTQGFVSDDGLDLVFDYHLDLSHVCFVFFFYPATPSMILGSQDVCECCSDEFILLDQLHA